MHRVGELLRRRRFRIVGKLVVRRRLAVGAPHPLERAGRGVEDDDAVVEVAVGDIQLVGRGIDHHVGGASELRRVLLLLVIGPDLPICSTNFPARVNFRTIPSVMPLPADPDEVVVINEDAVLVGRPVVPWPGPPHACTTLPSWSNSTTEGAGLQHLTLGVVEARFSRASRVPGRWLTQMWSCASTKIPPIWPKIHWFGSVFGHDGSIWNFGIAVRGERRPSHRQPR